ncbi:MAG: hypothetical protein ABIA21_00455 [Candidatus Aenigmatarchaeota archaeon]
MSRLLRAIYLMALIVGVIIYMSLMGGLDHGVTEILLHMIPASGVAILFLLALCVMGEGIKVHIKAFALLLVIIFIISMAISMIGSVPGVSIPTDVSNLSNITNTSNLSVPNISTS